MQDESDNILLNFNQDIANAQQEITLTNKPEKLRVLICDHLNLARGKTIPMPSSSDEIHMSVGIYALDYQGNILPAPGGGMSTGFEDVVARFEHSDIYNGWHEDSGVVVADLYSQNDPFVLCPRAALKRAVLAWSEKGYDVKIGIELEAYLFKRQNEEWLPYDAPAACVYGTGSSSDPDGILDRIWQQAHACGFQLEAIHSEFDPAQFEFCLSVNDALTALDQAFLFRLMAKEICEKENYKLSFMPKPLSDRAGSGVHINLSLHDKSGNNAFMDEHKEDGLSSVIKHCISGLVHHHKALAGIQAPTVNSYKRLRPGELSAYWANWGYDHRGCTVRIPSERGQSTRLEHRLADGSANPYIAATASLQACLLGLEKSYDLSEAENQDCIENSDANITVADELGQALKDLIADHALCEAIGMKIINHHVSIKQDEWQRYVSTTSDWEIREYFNLL